MAIINPYEGIHWGSIQHIPSCSHEHCENPSHFTNLIDGGLQHIALSNYHPSKPWYPLADHFSVPEGIIGSPNAEFYNMNINNFHANGLGTFYEEPDPNEQHSWEYKFERILLALQYADGGGITLNHPAWTKAVGHDLTNQDLIKMLDFDQRVLGIEFFNAGTQGNTENMWDLDTWDFILKTGRRCWGFCVADHDGQSNTPGYSWRGRNVLLLDSFTEHDCLKAYRNGQFYGSIYNTSLKFTDISLSGNSLFVTATDAEYINFVVNGVTTQINGSTASISIPSGAIYARVEAHNSDNSIFSNPIIFRPFIKKDNTDAENLLLLFNP